MIDYLSRVNEGSNFIDQTDILLGTSVIMTGAIYFYLANELISISENYGRLGLPLPTQVKQVIQVLKNKGDASNDQGLWLRYTSEKPRQLQHSPQMVIPSLPVTWCQVVGRH